MVDEQEISYVELTEDLADIPDETTKPDGEYQVQLVTFELATSKNDPNRQMFHLQLEVVGEPLVKTIGHWLLIPNDSDDEKSVLRRKRAQRSFFEAFDIPTSGRIEFEEHIGKTGWAILVEEENKEYGKQNRVRRFVKSSK